MNVVARRWRILVALDDSAHGLAAIETAGDLARRLEADVTALFVEDVELVRLAGLPFASEIGIDAMARPLDLPRLERRFRRQVRELRAACERVAERSRQKVRLEVARGAVAGEILAAAGEEDLIVLGRAGATRRPRGPAAGGRVRFVPLGSTTRSVLLSSTRTVAVVSAWPGTGRPVAVVYDGSEAARRGLDLGMRLAEEDHRNLVVLVPASVTRGDALAEEADGLARQAGFVARCERVADSPAAVAEAVARLGCRALVVVRHGHEPGRIPLVDLLEALDCPVFVVG